MAPTNSISYRPQANSLWYKAIGATQTTDFLHVHGVVRYFFTNLRGSYSTGYMGLWRWHSIFFYDASFLTRNSSLIIEGVKRIALINWNGRNMQ